MTTQASVAVQPEYLESVTKAVEVGKSDQRYKFKLSNIQAAGTVTVVSNKDVTLNIDVNDVDHGTFALKAGTAKTVSLVQRSGGPTTTYCFVDINKPTVACEVTVHLGKQPSAGLAQPSLPQTQTRLWTPGFAMGINIAGAEFGDKKTVGTHAKDYIYPLHSHMKLSADQGFKYVRYPFRLERIFQTLGGAFRSDDISKLDKAMDDAAKLGLLINLDAHNYLEWNGVEIKDGKALAASWVALAQRYKAHPAIESFGIMNEPHTKGTWWPIAAIVQDAVTRADPNRNMTFCGDAYANSFDFVNRNRNIEQFTFGPRSALELHIYFDEPHSGLYPNRKQILPADIGVKRINSDGLAWAKARNVPIVIGEFGLPWDMNQDPLIPFINEAKKYGMRSYAWAAGPWWTASSANGICVNGQWRAPADCLKRYV
jgi:endoglucanase